MMHLSGQRLFKNLIDARQDGHLQVTKLRMRTSKTLGDRGARRRGFMVLGEMAC